MPSVQELQNGKYRLSFCVDGHRASRVIQAKTRKEAEKQAIILEENLRQTGKLDGQTSQSLRKMTVGELFTKYMTYQTSERTKKIALKTEQKYKDIWKYQIEPYFQGMKVVHVQESDINKFLNYLRTPEARFNKSKRKRYSDGTIKDAFTLLQGMFKYAVEKLHVIPNNPCDTVDKPTIDDRGEMVYYNAEQLAELLNIVDQDTHLNLAELAIKEQTGKYQAFTLQKEKLGILYKRAIVYLGIYTAARRGEILGIHRQDINFEEKYIHFCHSVLYTKEKGIFMTNRLKSTEENWVGVNDEILGILEELINELDKLFEVSNGIIPKTDMLFIALNQTRLHPAGGLPYPDPYSEWFKLLLERYNLPPMTFHKLRHSSISYMLYKGIKMETVAKIAGHKSTEQIQKTYGHVYRSEVVNAAFAFDGIKGGTEDA